MSRSKATSTSLSPPTVTHTDNGTTGQRSSSRRGRPRGGRNPGRGAGRGPRGEASLVDDEGLEGGEILMELMEGRGGGRGPLTLEVVAGEVWDEGHGHDHVRSAHDRVLREGDASQPQQPPNRSHSLALDSLPPLPTSSTQSVIPSSTFSGAPFPGGQQADERIPAAIPTTLHLTGGSAPVFVQPPPAPFGLDEFDMPRARIGKVRKKKGPITGAGRFSVSVPNVAKPSSHQRSLFSVEQRAPERGASVSVVWLTYLRGGKKEGPTADSSTFNKAKWEKHRSEVRVIAFGGPLDCVTLICHASLWSSDGKDERNIVVNPRGHGDEDNAAAAALTSSNPRPAVIPPIAPTHIDTPPSGYGYHPYLSHYDWHAYPPYPHGDPHSYDVLHQLIPSRTLPASSSSSGPPQSKTAALTSASAAIATGTIWLAEASAAGLTQGQRLCQTLLGSLAVPCTILTDLDGSEGMFFVFHDLSVRAQGTYRLRFQVVDADGSKKVSSSKAIAWSNVFEVFSPKVFPGMTESTALSRSFAKQGLPIHIRKDYAAIHSTSPPLQAPLEG
ncbi:hypothetical protein HDU67_007589 [Dinochytrium kinnereticum]|nr:hypothetical protein HDU67_007589 [Dinochytrium kinnereticum]